MEFRAVGRRGESAPPPRSSSTGRGGRRRRPNRGELRDQKERNHQEDSRMDVQDGRSHRRSNSVAERRERSVEFDEFPPVSQADELEIDGKSVYRAKPGNQWYFVPDMSRLDQKMMRCQVLGASLLPLTKVELMGGKAWNILMNLKVEGNRMFRHGWQHVLRDISKWRQYPIRGVPASVERAFEKVEQATTTCYHSIAVKVLEGGVKFCKNGDSYLVCRRDLQLEEIVEKRIPISETHLGSDFTSTKVPPGEARALLKGKIPSALTDREIEMWGRGEIARVILSVRGRREKDAKGQSPEMRLAWAIIGTIKSAPPPRREELLENHKIVISRMVPELQELIREQVRKGKDMPAPPSGPLSWDMEDPVHERNPQKKKEAHQRVAQVLLKGGGAWGEHDPRHPLAPKKEEHQKNPDKCKKGCIRVSHWNQGTKWPMIAFDYHGVCDVRDPRELVQEMGYERDTPFIIVSFLFTETKNFHELKRYAEKTGYEVIAVVGNLTPKDLVHLKKDILFDRDILPGIVAILDDHPNFWTDRDLSDQPRIRLGKMNVPIIGTPGPAFRRREGPNRTDEPEKQDREKSEERGEGVRRGRVWKKSQGGPDRAAEGEGHPRARTQGPPPPGRGTSPDGRSAPPHSLPPPPPSGMGPEPKSQRSLSRKKEKRRKFWEMKGGVTEEKEGPKISEKESEVLALRLLPQARMLLEAAGYERHAITGDGNCALHAAKFILDGREMTPEEVIQARKTMGKPQGYLHEGDVKKVFPGMVFHDPAEIVRLEGDLPNDERIVIYRGGHFEVMKKKKKKEEEEKVGGKEERGGEKGKKISLGQWARLRGGHSRKKRDQPVPGEEEEREQVKREILSEGVGGGQEGPPRDPPSPSSSPPLLIPSSLIPPPPPPISHSPISTTPHQPAGGIEESSSDPPSFAPFGVQFPYTPIASSKITLRLPPLPPLPSSPSPPSPQNGKEKQGTSRGDPVRLSARLIDDDRTEEGEEGEGKEEGAGEDEEGSERVRFLQEMEIKGAERVPPESDDEEGEPTDFAEYAVNYKGTSLEAQEKFDEAKVFLPSETSGEDPPLMAVTDEGVFLFHPQTNGDTFVTRTREGAQILLRGVLGHRLTQCFVVGKNPAFVVVRDDFRQMLSPEEWRRGDLLLETGQIVQEVVQSHRDKVRVKRIDDLVVTWDHPSSPADEEWTEENVGLVRIIMEPHWGRISTKKGWCSVESSEDITMDNPLVFSSVEAVTKRTLVGLSEEFLGKHPWVEKQIETATARDLGRCSPLFEMPLEARGDRVFAIESSPYELKNLRVIPPPIRKRAKEKLQAREFAAPCAISTDGLKNHLAAGRFIMSSALLLLLIFLENCEAGKSSQFGQMDKVNKASRSRGTHILVEGGYEPTVVWSGKTYTLSSKTAIGAPFTDFNQVGAWAIHPMSGDPNMFSGVLDPGSPGDTTESIVAHVLQGCSSCSSVTPGLYLVGVWTTQEHDTNIYPNPVGGKSYVIFDFQGWFVQPRLRAFNDPIFMNDLWPTLKGQLIVTEKVPVTAAVTESGGDAWTEGDVVRNIVGGVLECQMDPNSVFTPYAFCPTVCSRVTVFDPSVGESSEKNVTCRVNSGGAIKQTLTLQIFTVRKFCERGAAFFDMIRLKNPFCYQYLNNIQKFFFFLYLVCALIFTIAAVMMLAIICWVIVSFLWLAKGVWHGVKIVKGCITYLASKPKVVFPRAAYAAYVAISVTLTVTFLYTIVTAAIGLVTPVGATDVQFSSGIETTVKDLTITPNLKVYQGFAYQGGTGICPLMQSQGFKPPDCADTSARGMECPCCQTGIPNDVGKCFWVTDDTINCMGCVVTQFAAVGTPLGDPLVWGDVLVRNRTSGLSRRYSPQNLQLVSRAAEEAYSVMYILLPLFDEPCQLTENFWNGHNFGSCKIESDPSRNRVERFVRAFSIFPPDLLMDVLSPSVCLPFINGTNISGRFNKSLADCAMGNGVRELFALGHSPHATCSTNPDMCTISMDRFLSSDITANMGMLAYQSDAPPCVPGQAMEECTMAGEGSKIRCNTTVNGVRYDCTPLSEGITPSTIELLKSTFSLHLSDDLLCDGVANESDHLILRTDVSSVGSYEIVTPLDKSIFLFSINKGVDPIECLTANQTRIVLTPADVQSGVFLKMGNGQKKFATILTTSSVSIQNYTSSVDIRVANAYSYCTSLYPSALCANGKTLVCIANKGEEKNWVFNSVAECVEFQNQTLFGYYGYPGEMVYDLFSLAINHDEIMMIRLAEAAGGRRDGDGTIPAWHFFAPFMGFMNMSPGWLAVTCAIGCSVAVLGVRSMIFLGILRIWGRIADLLRTRKGKKKITWSEKLSKIAWF